MRRNREAGQALFITAASMVILAGFAGLAIDLGVLRYEKRVQQTAADGAAMAGANELRYGSGLVGITSAANDAANANGFGDTGTYCSKNCPSSGSVGFVTVTVNSPPTSGPHAAQAGCSPNPSCYVEVLVSAVHPTYFMPVVGANTTATVTARAVATLVSSSGTAPGCVYTLGAGVSGDITGAGTPSLSAPSCGIEDDGGLTANGANVSITAASIGVADMGADKINNKATISPAPVNIAPVGDPLSYFPNPVSAGNCTTTYNSDQTYNSSQTFSPGVYCILGNLSINGNGTFTGTGVTFYVTGNITINGTSTVQFSAPNSGPYAGLLFWDPSANATATLDGTNTSYYQGAIYVPGSGSLLKFGGTNFSNVTCNGTTTTNCSQYTIIVADQLQVKGTPTINIGSNYSSLPGGVTIVKNANLVE